MTMEAFLIDVVEAPIHAAFENGELSPEEYGDRLNKVEAIREVLKDVEYDMNA